MTIDDQVEQRLKEVPCNDTQQQQRPFHIVLVDISKAVSGRIHCVELPLEGDLTYVALSYRWGELQEKMIDTNVDYTSTITSFRLEDFCQICRLMTIESDLCDIKYVWVDAICVDQNNYERRKATIHQMTNIYEHASYIVAVPDLHLQYLKNVSAINREIIQRAAPFRKDIYYLLHRNIDPLIALEEERLDFYGVPKDPALRQLLTQYTNYFAEGLTTFREHSYDYNPEEILDHIYESSRASCAAAVSTHNPDSDGLHFPSDKDQVQAVMVVGNKTSGNDLLDEIKCLHNCNKVPCPFIHFIHGKFSTHHPKKFGGHVSDERSGRNREWKQQIYDRSTIIRRSMSLLADLIVDWSSRAWVISEYNIAKKKNNLKYWFIQLIPGGSIKNMHQTFGETFTFFEFNFNDPSHADIQNTIIKPTIRSSKTVSSDPVYLTFHQVMIRQLNEQTFLEMMLKSKASKHEDRFYSVLPLSKYKDKLTNKESVASWKINTLLSVKLKLYDWMDIKDKLNLLFLSCNRKEGADLTLILPTFATPSIYWPRFADCFPTGDDAHSPFNFDLTSESTIMLLDDDEDLHYLHLKPLEYYVHADGPHKESCQEFLREKKALCKRVHLDDLGDDMLDVIAIPNVGHAAVVKAHGSLKHARPFWINLIGSFVNNKWVFDKCTWTCSPTDASDWIHHDSRDDHTGFNIY